SCATRRRRSRPLPRPARRARGDRMGFWGGGGAGGWSSSATSMGGGNARRGMDGWSDDDLGKVYDSAVVTRLVPYLRPHRVRVTVALIAMLGFSVASTIQPLLISFAVDEAIRGDVAAVSRTALLL